MYIAALAYFFILAGLLMRKNKLAHMKFMGLGITIDLLIVLVLQLQRNAVQTAMDFSLSNFQQAHIIVSTIAVLFYIPVVTLGILRYQKKYGQQARNAHVVFGILAFIFRSLGFIFMFSMLGKQV